MPAKSILFIVAQNNFRDEEGEIVTRAALERAVKKMDRRRDYGIVDWWHVKLNTKEAQRITQELEKIWLSSK